MVEVEKNNQTWPISYFRGEHLRNKESSLRVPLMRTKNGRTSFCIVGQDLLPLFVLSKDYKESESIHASLVHAPRFFFLLYFSISFDFIISCNYIMWV